MVHVSDTILDVRGLGCPIPTMKTKKAMKTLNPGDALSVLVDSKDAIADVRALLRQRKDVTFKENRTGDTSMTFLITRL